jgi:GxxExxY protein
VIELRKRGHDVEQQKPFVVRYDNEPVGKGTPDLIVDSLVIVDPKVARALDESHVAQMIGYLEMTKLNLALLINFKFARLEWKRVIRGQTE